MRTIILQSLRLFAYGSGLSTVKGLNQPIIRQWSSHVSLRLSSHAASQNVASRSSETHQVAKSHKGKYRLCTESIPDPRHLVVGDGDLSYSASIAQQAARSGISLLASVLESELEHTNVYSNSLSHQHAISKFPSHQVLFETDATKLHQVFPPDYFQQIQFNFPHWTGRKSNNRYNRELLANFLASAGQVLRREGGEIQVALRTEQGGARAQDITEWKLGWKASELATDAGLLLSRLDPFQVRHLVAKQNWTDSSGECPDLTATCAYLVAEL
jgi:Domain of unknown function (DUF2431)